MRITVVAILVACAAAIGGPATAGAAERGASSPPAARVSRRRLRLRDRRRRRRLSLELARKGEAELRKSVQVFEQKLLLKAGRLELTAGGAMGMNDALVQNYSTDGGLLFHASDTIAIGVTASKVFANETEYFQDIQKDFGLFPERAFLQAAGFAEFQYSPIVGKFASFGMAVLEFDGYLLGAGGVVRTTTNARYKPALQLGAGARIHLLRGLTLSLEIRDALYLEDFLPASVRGPPETGLIQHLTVGAKFGLWIPPSFTYKYPR